MSRKEHTIGPLIAYHGCEATLAERVLHGQDELVKSNNDYDWLGPGVYFWVDSPERGYEWALEQKRRGNINEPAVIGAYIYPHLCLNLTDYGVMDDIQFAYEFLTESLKATGSSIPVNSRSSNGLHLKRPLDCSVIKMAHTIRALNGENPFDSVYGVFEEGAELFPGAGIKRKTHVQIAVCHPDQCILGYFRVKS